MTDANLVRVMQAQTKRKVGLIDYKTVALGEVAIRERIAAGEDRPNYGFLLAYIGHQTGERALVEEGLAQFSGNESLDTYGALLRGIWLGGK
jgi:hypothetical protein